MSLTKPTSIVVDNQNVLMTYYVVDGVKKVKFEWQTYTRDEFFHKEYYSRDVKSSFVQKFRIKKDDVILYIFWFERLDLNDKGVGYRAFCEFVNAINCSFIILEPKQLALAEYYVHLGFRAVPSAEINQLLIEKSTFLKNCLSNRRRIRRNQVSNDAFYSFIIGKENVDNYFNENQLNGLSTRSIVSQLKYFLDQKYHDTLTEKQYSILLKHLINQLK